jgi:hypothetical protein
MNVNDLDEDALQLLYGAWDPLLPEQVRDLLAGVRVRWYVAGGRAARVGAPARLHSDTDVVVRATDVDALRAALAAWHLWEANSGALRPLLPGAALSQGCEQLWLRRDATQPWRLDLPLDQCSTDDEWVFKRDARVRLPWSRAVHTTAGITYLRPEVALLYKARAARPKDQADLAAARLDNVGRAWLAETLELLGHHAWALEASADQELS